MSITTWYHIGMIGRGKKKAFTIFPCNSHSIVGLCFLGLHYLGAPKRLKDGYINETAALACASSAASSPTQSVQDEPQLPHFSK